MPTTLDIIREMTHSRISVLDILKVILTWRSEDQGLLIATEVPAILDLIFTYETCRAQTTEWITMKAAHLYAGDV
jgi:hypothetical protein